MLLESPTPAEGATLRTGETDDPSPAADEIVVDVSVCRLKANQLGARAAVHCKGRT
jgi:hypothetical protein